MPIADRDLSGKNRCRLRAQVQLLPRSVAHLATVKSLTMLVKVTTGRVHAKPQKATSPRPVGLGLAMLPSDVRIDQGVQSTRGFHWAKIPFGLSFQIQACLSKCHGIP